MATPRLDPDRFASRRAARIVRSASGGTSARPPIRSMTPAGRSWKAQLVDQFDELHRRLQQVVAVRPAADDVQAQIELRRRRPGRGETEQRSRRSLPETPAIDDDAHAGVAARRPASARAPWRPAPSNSSGSRCASRSARATRAVFARPFDPVMLARRRQSEHPIAQMSRRHFGAETRLELGPRGLRLAASDRRLFRAAAPARPVAAHLHAHAADADRTANLDLGAIAALRPLERS